MTREVQKEIFVSCAGQDRDQARELVEHLEKLGCTAFIFTRDIPPGKRGVDVMSQKLRDARLFAPLISSNTKKKAHYQVEEIDFAIEIWRKDPQRLTIVPIFLEDIREEDSVLGLRTIQHLRLKDLGMEATAAALAGELGKGRAPGSSATPATESGTSGPALVAGVDVDPPTGPATVGAVLHDAFTELDRSHQWASVLRIFATPTSGITAFHGPRKENPRYFLYRVESILPWTLRRHFWVVPVSFLVDTYPPEGPAGWENRIARACAAVLKRGSGTAKELLRAAARNQEVVLFLPRPPLDLDDLEEQDFETLVDFLGSRLPKLLREASEGVQPIRAILTSQDGSTENSWLDRLDYATNLGCDANGLAFERLPVMEAVEWRDVEAYLRSRKLPKGAKTIAKVKAGFEALKQEGMEFRHVAELLERLIGS